MVSLTTTFGGTYICGGVGGGGAYFKGAGGAGSF